MIKMIGVLIFNVFLALLAGASAQDIEATFNFTSGMVEESAGVFAACVELSQAPSTSVNITVGIQVASGNLELGVNFQDPVPNMFTFSPSNPLQQCFTVVIIQDGIVRSSQILLLMLTSSDDSVTIPRSEILNIIDSDILEVTWSSDMYQTVEGTPVEVCADVVSGSLEQGSTLSATVTPTFTGSAIAGIDFVASPSVINFNSGDAQTCTPLSTFDNNEIEGTESFDAVLSASAFTQLEFVMNTTTIYIIDNDVATIGFTETEIVVEEGNGSMQRPLDVCVELMLGNQALERVVTGTVQTESITAAAGQDFLFVRRSFNFTSDSNSGDTYCFTVTIIGDDTIEQNETFRVVLSSSTNDTVDPSQVEITLIHDGDVNLCPALPDIDNGEVLVTGFLAGDMATYSCNEGYWLRDGAIERECRVINNVGVWSGNEPRCVPVCPDFVVMNGNVTVSGDIATTVCDFSYLVSSGDSVRTCRDQEWTGNQPVCSLANCGPLKIGNGTVSHQSTLFESEATYECNTGFTLAFGDRVRTCRADGTWSGEMPTCNGALRGVVSTGLLSVLLTALVATLFTRL